MHLTRPGETQEMAVSFSGQDGYFLFFRFRIAMIRSPKVRMIWMSTHKTAYVLRYSIIGEKYASYTNGVFSP